MSHCLLSLFFETVPAAEMLWGREEEAMICAQLPVIIVECVSGTVGVPEIEVGEESALDWSPSELTPPNIVPTSPGQELNCELEYFSGEEFLLSTLVDDIYYDVRWYSR